MAHYIPCFSHISSTTSTNLIMLQLQSLLRNTIKKLNSYMKPTSSRPELVRCMPGPKMTLQSGNSSTSVLYMSMGNVAVTKRYCEVTGANFNRRCSTSSNSSSPKSTSTSSNTALLKNRKKWIYIPDTWFGNLLIKLQWQTC